MSTPSSGGFPKRENMFEREPARRVFAGELREIREQFRDGTDEKSPSYVLSAHGAAMQQGIPCRVDDRKKRQGEQNMFYRARIVDPTGTFFVVAGVYQPEAMQQMARIEPPAFVAVVGKPSIYETPDGTGPGIDQGGIYYGRRQGDQGLLGSRHGKGHVRPS